MRKCFQEQDRQENVCRLLRLQHDPFAPGNCWIARDDLEDSDRDHGERAGHEQIGRQGEDSAGLTKPTQISDGE